MNDNLFNADRSTHFKIIVLGSLGAIFVTWAAIAADLGAGNSLQSASPYLPPLLAYCDYRQVRCFTANLVKRL